MIDRRFCRCQKDPFVAVRMIVFDYGTAKNMILRRIAGVVYDPAIQMYQHPAGARQANGHWQYVAEELEAVP